MGGIAAALMDAVYPRRCPYCHDAVRPRGAFICEDCADGFSYIEGNTCAACGKELTREGRYCADCEKHPDRPDGGIALMEYDDPARRSMYMFKYGGRREYAAFYAAELIRRRGNELFSFRPDVMIPVPIHGSRLRQRGYNQAAEIAYWLSALTGIPVLEGLLIRGKKTEAQKALGAGMRRVNLEHAFRAEGRLPEGCRVLLVDDIYTTGATVRACAGILRGAGADKVFSCAACTGRDI